MGCVTSKKAVAVTPTFDSTGVSQELDGLGGILADSLWSRAREEADCSESGESGKVSSTRTSSRSFRLGNLYNYIEGEQAAAGWPSWLSTVAKEAIQGWVPLKSESFQKLEKIGQGTYSSVFRARDLGTGRMVALKKVRFDNFEPESVRFMAREILILRRLDHPNIVRLEGLITSRSSTSMYLVFEYMEHDLAGLSSCPDIKFTESQVKCYMHQLLSGLEHCHLRGVMHRDIKCANLLISNEGILKMADFGLANFFNPGRRLPLTSRVVTLWYRPPELLLGSTDYEATIDLWSVGCIFAEMFLKKPILQGRTEVEQIHKIFKLCGSPPDEYWKKSKLPHATLFKPQQSYGNRLRETLRCLPESAFSLLETFLSVEPYKRGTASTALSSEYFTTKPYASEPSSLPKYSPNKEIDAKSREDRQRKLITYRGHGPEATRRSSGTSRARQPNGPSKLGARPEEPRNNTHGFNKIGLKQDRPKLDRDSRLYVDLQPMPLITPPDKVQRSKHISQERLPLSASNSFVWVKRQKEDRPYVRSNSRSNSRGQTSGALEPLDILEARNNYEPKGRANAGGGHEACIDSKGHKLSDMAKHVMLKQWGQIEHPTSLDASGAYHSQDLSQALYRRGAVSSKFSNSGFQDQGDRVEFSGPLLSDSHKVDELLERHERHMRRAGRRSWFQRGKKEGL